MIQWLRSVAFLITTYGSMLPIGLFYTPWAILSPAGATAACHCWCAWVRWSAGWMVGLRTQILGTPPVDEVIIAAKHQSFLDIVLIYGAVPRGKFIMKRSLIWAPVLGQMALRMGCIPVDRGKRTQAIRKMIADVAAGRSLPGQLIIYPQGTRIAPGVRAPYKIGSGVLYQDSGQDCVPVACNVGLFWPRKGILKRPGLATVEFLPRIPAGLTGAQMMAILEPLVEDRSNQLMAEAGFPVRAP